MSSYLITANLSLGLEMLGGIIFFVVAWLFFEAYLLKKDWFSLAKSLGFLLFAASQGLNALNLEGGAFTVVLPAVYGLGLLLILLAFGVERLPPKPVLPAIAILTLGGTVVSSDMIFVLLSLLISFFLILRYFKDIDRDLKWMAIAFILLTASLACKLFPYVQGDYLWTAEQVLKVVAFISLCLWIWRFLSLRLREEALIVFTSLSLAMALLVTTAFSAVLFQKSSEETSKSLGQSAQIAKFYLENLKSRGLAVSQIISKNETVASSFEAHDIKSLEKITNELLDQNQEDFLTATAKNGDVFFKNTYPILREENVSDRKITAEALEGRPAVTINDIKPEGLSVQAASLVVSMGKPVGAVIVGSSLNTGFLETMKKITGFEATLVIGNKAVASTVLPQNSPFDVPSDSYNGLIKTGDEEMIAQFSPIADSENRLIATLVLTTTPHEIINRIQSSNRLTILIVFLISIIFIVPLYRFSVFLTEKIA
jgi:hypothetical protein